MRVQIFIVDLKKKKKKKKSRAHYDQRCYQARSGCFLLDTMLLYQDKIHNYGFYGPYVADS